MSQSLAETLQGLERRFRPGAVSAQTVYYLSLGDGEGEKWTVTLTADACQVAPGKPAHAACVLKMPAELFMKMVAGTHKPGPMDFMTGKIKTSDIDLLQRLQRAFGL
jgi:putative sterol carrier protein